MASFRNTSEGAAMGLFNFGSGRAKADGLRQGLRSLKGVTSLDVYSLRDALGEPTDASWDGNAKPCMWTYVWQAGGVYFGAKINKSDDDRLVSGFVVDGEIQGKSVAGEPLERYLARG